MSNRSVISEKAVLLKNPVSLGTMFLCGSAVFFVGEISLPLASPSYVVLLAIALVGAVTVIRTNRFVASWPLFVLVAGGLFVLLGIQETRYGLASGIVNEVARVVVPILYYPIAMRLFTMMRPRDRHHVVLQTQRFLLAFFALELGTRLALTVLYGQFTLATFYVFKPHSLFFADSNFPGYLLALNVAFLVIVRRFFQVPRRYVVFTLVLVVFTFSRASTITSIAVVFLDWADRHLSKPIFVGGFVAATLAGSVLVGVVQEYDTSFFTKLKIWQEFIRHYTESAPQQALLGIGSGNLRTVFRYASHTIAGLAVELGILWVVLIMLLNLWLAARSRWRALLLVFASLFPGAFSLYPIAYNALFFALVAFVTVLATEQLPAPRIREE